MYRIRNIMRTVTSSNIYESASRKISSRIPLSTWSLRDLNLKSQKSSQQQKIIEDEELDTLAQRCLLDVQNLSNDQRNELKLELGNMMRCISLVCETSATRTLADEEEMYDLPRGFCERSTPVRGEEEELGAWREGGSRESEALLKKLRHKTVQIKNDVGKEEVFFSIITTSY